MTRIIIVLQLVFVLLNAPLAFPADLTVTREISFGSITACPSGDIIEINAKSGPDEELAVLTKGCSIIDGGHSGAFRVTSDMAGQNINITYPDSVSLQAAGSAHTLKLDSMNILSKGSAVSTAADENLDFYVGGRLHIESGQPGDAYYSGTITIVIDIINP